jgi:beta-glucosidase
MRRARLLLLGTCLVQPAVVALAATPVVESQAFLDQHAPMTRRVRPADEARVRALLASMTLREKVGQMTQLTIAAVASGKDGDLRLDPSKLRHALVDYGVGSLLNVSDTAMPVEWWHATLRQIQATAAETRLKVPVVYGIDTIHGANYVTGATLFPQPIGMAATWNPELMLRGSQVAAAETRAAGIPWNFSPVLDVGRQPLWPRLYETFGEDSYLATVMGIATVRGYEGDDPAAATRVGACLKHYIGYSGPTSGHDRTPALLPEATLREHYLPPFTAAVKAGALSIMVNSGEVNGVAGHVNGYLLKDVLRGELGFDGVVVSDWEDIKKLVSIHRVAATEKEATRLAVLAGIDMSMVPSELSFADLLVELVEEGAVPLSRIDEAVGRILTMKARLGLFEDPLRGLEVKTQVGSAEARQLALDAARESLVLLKNERGLLPLSASARVLVSGPTADSLPALNNGWTLTWQGDRPELYPRDRPTILGALRARLGAAQVSHVAGASYDKELDVAGAVQAARQADVVVLCLGELTYAETPGNIDDLALPDAQLRLAQALASTGKPLVLVLVQGRPRLIRTIADAAGAILLALNPGHEGGRALADVLAGDVNPSGRLPISYPRFANALRTYDHKAFEEQDTGFGLKAYQPQFDFGAGLSYTRFEYSDLRLAASTLPAAGRLTLTVNVRNAGARAGSEVVQLYVSDHVASLTPPVKRLRRFAKLALQPGESRELRFELPVRELAFVGPDGHARLEPGTFSALVGGLKQDFSVQP